jgi:hypothetical protein
MTMEPNEKEQPIHEEVRDEIRTFAEEQETGQETISEPEEDVFSPSNDRYLYSGKNYGHGFFNGVLEVEPRHYEQYILGNEERNHIHRRLYKLRDRIAGAQRKILQLRSDKEGFLRAISKNKYELEKCEEELEYQFNQREKLDARIRGIKHSIKDINPYYVPFVAVLFIIAAFAFMVAEFFITRDVFFHILDMQPLTAIPLAAAISLLTIALKPAVDRIFEEPYLRYNKKAVNYFLGVFGVLALIALGFLGYFRNIGEAANFLADQREVAAPASDIFDEPTTELPGTIAEETQAAANIMQHRSIVIVFTLSSILFALAGAICFSIGIPVINLFRKKKRLKEELEAEKDHFSSLEKGIVEKREEIADKKYQIEISEVLLGELDDLDEAEKLLEILNEQELMELERQYDVMKVAAAGLYQDGYDRGTKYELNGKLQVTPYDLRKVRKGASSNGNGTAPSKKKVKKSPNRLQQATCTRNCETLYT